MTTPTARRVFTLLAALTMSISAPLPLLLLGTLAVQLRHDLGLDESHIGVASTAFFLGSTSLSVACGNLTQRIGWQRAARIAAMTSALSMLAVAAFADGLWTFIALFVIGSIGHATAGPAGNVAIASEMPTHRMALLFGMKQTANPLANIVAGASVPIIGLTLGWRWAFALCAVFPAISIAATFHASTRRVGAPEEVVDADTPPAPEPLPEGVRVAPIVAMAVAAFFASYGSAAIGAFVVLTAVDAGVEEGTAGLFVGAAAFVGLTVRVASGWWADRTGSAGLRPMVAMLAVGSLSYVLLASGTETLMLPAAVLAYGAGWGWPGLYQFSIAHHYRGATGRITGRVMTGMMAGGVVSPLVFGFLHGHWGYGVAWLNVGLSSLLGAIATAWAAHELRDGPRAAFRLAAA